MKTNYLKQIILVFFISCFAFTACNDDGIDPISSIPQGTDESAPIVNIVFPVEGTKIRVVEDVTDIQIKFEVTDDIEVSEIQIKLDGVLLATFTDFPDYRRVLETFEYGQLTNGDHVLDVIAKDLSGKETTSTVNFEKVPPYQARFDGEIFYMPFDNNYLELLNLVEAEVVGTPSFAGESTLSGTGLNAYKGFVDSYLSVPLSAFMTGDETEFSATFWMKVNAVDTRSGILVIGPPDEANPSSPNNRKAGFRFFREGSDATQRFKLNAGHGAGDSWFDGGSSADVPVDGEWVHFAFTISPTEVLVYINGNVVKQGGFSGISWENCTQISIMSGAPNFIGWNHKSDQGFMDELRLFNKALTNAEVNAILNATID